jgi:hypothetical protein
MDLQEMKWEVKDWIDLAQDKDKWWALVNAVLTFDFHKKRRIS